MKLVKFEKNRCPECVMVGNFLDSKGLEYEKVDIENHSDLEYISEHVSMAVPVVVLFDNEGNKVGSVVKFRPDELEELITKL